LEKGELKPLAAVPSGGSTTLLTRKESRRCFERSDKTAKLRTVVLLYKVETEWRLITTARLLQVV
jgi:hypothetical protein